MLNLMHLAESPPGEVLSDSLVSYTYTFAGNLVESMDIGAAEL